MAEHKRRPRPKGSRQAFLPVHDPQALGDLLRDAARNLGGQAQAARRVGLSQPALSRLIAGKRRSISWATLDRLSALVGVEGHRALVRAIENPAAMEVMRDYKSWLTVELKHALGFKRVSGEWVCDEDLLRDVGRLRELLSARFPTLFKAFDQLLARRVISERAQLAYWRILGPLLRGPPLSSMGLGIETHRWELSDQAVRQFVEAGVRRETILLGGREGVLRKTAKKTPCGTPVRAGLAKSLDRAPHPPIVGFRMSPPERVHMTHPRRQVRRCTHTVAH
jgi:transcriptional regulator with XRE-family HTH domain